MYSESQEIRSYLKTLTTEDIANSFYLIGVNFDTVDLDTLFGYIIALYNNVMDLQSLIDRNFQPENDEKVLLPTDPKVQANIIIDYNKKSEALSKILENDAVNITFWIYKEQQDTKESHV